MPICMVGDLEHVLILFNFSIQLGISIPTDELIFFRGVGVLPASNDIVDGCEILRHQKDG